MKKKNESYIDKISWMFTMRNRISTVRDYMEQSAENWSEAASDQVEKVMSLIGRMVVIGEQTGHLGTVHKYQGQIFDEMYPLVTTYAEDSLETTLKCFKTVVSTRVGTWRRVPNCHSELLYMTLERLSHEEFWSKEEIDNISQERKDEIIRVADAFFKTTYRWLREGNVSAERYLKEVCWKMFLDTTSITIDSDRHWYDSVNWKGYYPYTL